MSLPVPQRRRYDVFAETSDDDEGALEGSEGAHRVEQLGEGQRAEVADFMATGRRAHPLEDSVETSDGVEGQGQRGAPDRRRVIETSGQPDPQAPTVTVQHPGENSRRTGRARTSGAGGPLARPSSTTRRVAPPTWPVEARPSSLLSASGLTKSEFKPPLRTPGGAQAQKSGKETEDARR